MSFSGIRAYFKDRALELGFKEHKDQAANNPRQTIDKSYMVTFRPFQSIKQNQTALEMNCQIDVTLFFKGAKDITKTEDAALDGAQDFIAACLKASNRLTDSHMVNLVLENLALENQDDTNDNTIKAILGFRALTIIGTER